MMRWSRKGRAVELLLTLFTYNPFVMSDLCPQIPNVKIGKLTYMPGLETRAYPVGTIATLQCPETHIAVGPAVTVCTQSGWNIKMGRCKSLKDGKPCSEITNFPGVIIYSNEGRRNQVPSGTVAYFKCPGKTTLKNYDRSLCYDSGWSNTNAECAVESAERRKKKSEQQVSGRCPAMVGDKHSNLFYMEHGPDGADTYEEGARITKECRIGFELHGPSEATCVRGKWTELGKCVKN